MKNLLKIKSQIWSLDLFIAIVIFLSAFALFYKYGLNAVYEEEKDTSALLLDGKIISGYLISEGYPKEWTTDDVTLIGLTNGNMDINPVKVSRLSAMDYYKSKRLLSTMNDYYVFFEDRNNNTINISGVEYLGKDYKADNPKDIVKVVRIVSYNSSLARMVVYIW